MNLDCKILAEEIIDKAVSVGKTISTAESCTGGMIAAVITSISGSSQVFGYGFVTYSNDAKVKLLDVPEDVIKAKGAVSEEVALAMSYGARMKSGADVALSVTGIAGPTGGTESKPVGLVYISVSTERDTKVSRFIFQGDRDEIRNKTLHEGLLMILSEI
jgi:PncC family amidohydrolase